MSLTDLVNKEVPFKFSGEKMNFLLSLGLFSSHDIDSGSKLLLKTVAQQIDLENTESILDMGCGVGVIGISLKKSLPDARIILRDRDALAVAFSQENARKNKVSGLTFENALSLENLEVGSFDLLISNLPAKAGETVLKDFFKRSVKFITEKGVVAVVIVSPLAEFAENQIRHYGHELLHKEETYHYTVFHFKGKDDTVNSDDLAIYIRNHDRFQLKKTSYNLETAYNIPDFDQTGYRITHAAEILNAFQLRGTGLFWNPGQGHIPVYSSVKKNNHFKKLYLSGRDLLQIKITERNLQRERPQIETIALPLYSEHQLTEVIEEESLDFAAFDVTPVPRTEWVQVLKKSAKKILKPGGWFFVIGKSADIHKLIKENKGFTPLLDKKYKGVRGALFKKNENSQRRAHSHSDSTNK